MNNLIDKRPKNIRQGGGQLWVDDTLDDWDPSKIILSNNSR